MASVIVPTLNEGDHLPRLVKALARCTVPLEVVVADGGSTDMTVSVAEAAGATVVRSEAGRGSQMRAGAAMARGQLLVFIHADARIEGAPLTEIAALAQGGFAGAAAFRFAIDGDRWSYRVLEAGTRLRGRLLGLPYGDQGLIIGAELYDRIGGHAEIPLMEDVVIARRLRGFGGIRILPTNLPVSPRRWERDGPWRRTAANLVLLSRFLLGASPERLAARYDRGRAEAR